MINIRQIKFLDKVFVRRPYFEASAYKVDNLRDVLKTNVFKNAIWIASTEFYKELEKKDFDFDSLNKKERLTALKFYNRMTFRATPFGAFSAFGLADWSNGNAGIKNADADPVLHLLPSVQHELMELESKSLTGDVLIAVNPTLYPLKSGWRYSRHEADEKGKLSFFVYLLQYDQADERLLGYLYEKPLPIAALIQYLIELTDCTNDEAWEHIIRLVDEQVLITKHALSLLSKAPFEDQLSGNYNENLQLPGFISDNKSAFGKIKDGKSVYAGLELQGSIYLPDHCQQDILEALKALDLLAPVPPKNSLDKFGEAFDQKFGERKIPLLQALDPDLGVPFDEDQQAGEHELLKGLDFQINEKTVDQVTWSPVHKLLMKVWLQDSKRGAFEPVILTANDLAGLPGNNLPFPPSTSVFYSVSDDRCVFQNIGGATANALTGRFSAFSEDFEMFCKDISQQESTANPDVLFADIVQVSHRKIDNINRRRHIYDHVIPLNSFPADSALLPEDIDVLVRAGEILLLHRPTGKRVIPRLSTAFNYHHNEMPLFRFLCALQYKSIRANFDFDPEKVFPGLSFYPRIEYGHTVLSLARWYLDSGEIKALINQPLSISRLHLFCRERGIPVMISAGRGDQQLLFDLSNDEEAIFFLESLKDQSNPVITEFIISSKKGFRAFDKFNTQFVISLLNKEAAYHPISVMPEPTYVVRDFYPGSEWVYLKIYATYQSLEVILAETLLPWINQNGHRIKQWFFVRYYDTGSHLRVRFKVDISIVKDLQYELQSLIGSSRATGLLQKAYFDTYQREIERYSASLIEQVEEVFFKGSELVATRLIVRAGDQEEDQIWPIVHCYEMIIAFFESEWEQVIALSQWAANAFFDEHGGGKSLKRSMDDRFRAMRPALSEAVINGEEANAGSSGLNDSLRRLSQAAVKKGFDRRKLIADVVHMQINRIFSSEQRRHEALIWHCILKMTISNSKRRSQTETLVMDDC
jgi:thiopeptide-type bacteriocin biosynthesis protein